MAIAAPGHSVKNFARGANLCGVLLRLRIFLGILTLGILAFRQAAISFKTFE